MFQDLHVVKIGSLSHIDPDELFGRSYEAPEFNLCLIFFAKSLMKGSKMDRRWGSKRTNKVDRRGWSGRGERGGKKIEKEGRRKEGRKEGKKEVRKGKKRKR